MRKLLLLCALLLVRAAAVPAQQPGGTAIIYVYATSLSGVKCQTTQRALWIVRSGASAGVYRCSAADTLTLVGGTTLTDSASLRSALSDESGTGAALFAGGNIGAATATSINGLTVTTTTGTLTVPNGVTLTGPAASSSISTTLCTTASAAGVGNSGTSETDLATCTIPAGALSADGKAVRVYFFVTTANNANAKAVRLYFGSTVISMPQNGAGGGGVAQTSPAIIWRTGASSQLAWARGAQTAGGNEGANNNTVTTPAENTANAITVKVTGQGAASNDILLRGLVVEILN